MARREIETEDMINTSVDDLQANNGVEATEMRSAVGRGIAHLRAIIPVRPLLESNCSNDILSLYRDPGITCLELVPPKLQHHKARNQIDTYLYTTLRWTYQGSYTVQPLTRRAGALGALAVKYDRCSGGLYQRNEVWLKIEPPASHISFGVKVGKMHEIPPKE